MENNKRPNEKMYSSVAKRLTSEKKVIDDILKKSLNWKPKSIERLVVGISNEVYRVVHPVDNEENCILRIHHGEHKEFYTEKWAMDEVSKQGVPVPEIIVVDVLKNEDTIIYFCLEKEIKGQPLSVLLDDGLSPDEIKMYAYQAGVMLAKIHNVETLNYGHFIENGKAEYTHISTSMNLEKDYADLLAISLWINLPKKILDRAVEIVNNFESIETPHLLHIDYAPKHIFVHNKKIVGVIDFELCISGITSTDINRWRAEDSRISIMDIIEGYESVKTLPEDFWETMFIIQIHSAFRTMLYHFRVTGEKSEISRAAKELGLLLETNKALLV